METFGFLTLLVLSIITIVHMWKRVNINFIFKLIIAAIILISRFGFIIYWIWFFIKKPAVIEQKTEARTGAKTEEPKENFLKSVGEKITYKQTIWFYEHVAENFPQEELRDKYFNLFINFMTNPNLSVDEKLKILELNDKKLLELYPNNPIEKGTFYLDGLVGCYNLFEYILGNDLKILVQSDKGELNQDINNGSITSNSMTKYLQPIFAHSALIRGKQKEFSIKSSIWEKYNIPKFVEEY